MLYRGKGCLVIGISRTGKRWIGVRIAWPGQHGGHFLMSPLPWKFSLDESSFGTIYDLVCSRQLKIITDAPPFCFSSTPQGEVIIDWIKHARFPPFTVRNSFSGSNMLYTIVACQKHVSLIELEVAFKGERIDMYTLMINCKTGGTSLC